MITTKGLMATIAITVFALGSVYSIKNSNANEQVLGDSDTMGLDNNAKRSNNSNNKAPEKKSDLGDGAYVREYNDFGKPTVEVQPQEGPPYYYSQDEIQEPNPEDGVHDRQTPSWRLKEW